MFDEVFQVLQRLAMRRLVVAYSGGVDSHALLHLLTTHEGFSPYQVRAVHVHHGLQADADAWSEHCKQVCAELGVAFQLLRVDIQCKPGDSMEAKAREARYRALQENINKEEVLLTAQHQDDQAETLLVQLCRGAGPAGLAAMPVKKVFGNGLLVRPFLRVSRQAIDEYASQNALTWREDPSNENTRFTRNFIRHELMPVLKKRWPSIAETMARTAQHCAVANELLTDLADLDYQQVKTEQANALSIQALKQLSRHRQQNVIRYWLKKNNLPLPSQAIMAQIIDCSINAGHDAHPKITWKDVSLIRKNKQLVFYT